MPHKRSLAAMPRPVNDIDVNHMTYGNFIGVIYIFENQISESKLQQAWETLCLYFPVLSGRYDRKTQTIVAADTPEIKNQTSDLSLQTASAAKEKTEIRKQFIHEPGRRSVLAGKCPLATLTLTSLTDKGCVLGLAINHIITDAGGFHKIARYLADIYNDLPDKDAGKIPDWVTELPAFKFGTSRTWGETKTELARQSLKAPAPMRGLIGFTPYNLILWSMQKITAQERLCIHLTPPQVSKLKASALSESGEDWISTNAALCAHFTAIMVKLIHGNAPKKAIRMGQLLDLRNRYFEDPENLQSKFIGNAILIHTELADLASYDRGNLSRFFKAMVSELNTEFVQKRLDVIADSLRHGRTYPGLEMSTPLIAVNNQTKMPVYEIEFDGQKPINVIPQDVGDNIMFFPSSDGGVDIYVRDILNPKRQARLETHEWQERIFDVSPAPPK